MMLISWINAVILAGIIGAVLVRLAMPFGAHEKLAKLALAALGAAAFFGIARNLGSPRTYVPELWQTLLYAGVLTFLVRRLIVREKRRTAATVAQFRTKSMSGF